MASAPMGVVRSFWEVMDGGKGVDALRSSSCSSCALQRETAEGVPRSSTWRTLEFCVGIEDGTRDLSCR
eukprot:7353758-Prorocentrum_lima.AAC.1